MADKEDRLDGDIDDFSMPTSQYVTLAHRILYYIYQATHVASNLFKILTIYFNLKRHKLEERKKKMEYD